jgi:beta-galactosidase
LSGYYKKYFDDWWQRDIDAMVLRDRNHPSIVLWSIGNETAEQNWKTGGTERLQMLKKYVHELEPTRPVTAAIRPINDKPYTRNGFVEALDVVGYNYQEQWLNEFKERFPNQIMYISEAYPYFRGRDKSYKGYIPVNPWYAVANNDFVFGQFIWAGVDYLGESSGWPSTGWPVGLFDVCMFEKPRAAFHRSIWNDEPMVRIAVADQSLDIDPGAPHWSWPFLASHWNFPQYEGHVVEVHTTTNCNSVELFLNGESLGRRKTADYCNNTIKWYVPYKAGKIEAKGYIEDDQVATYSLQTAGEPKRVNLKLDRERIAADGHDLAHVEISLLDEKGILVQSDDRKITIEVQGDGKLLGLDTGDLRRSSYYGNSIQTYFGKALAILQSTRNAGEILINVKADGIPEETISLNTY